MTLLVSPMRHVEHMLTTHRPSHVMTLLAPDVDPPICADVPPDRRLILKFHDIVNVSPGLVMPSRGTVQGILDFGRGWDRQAPMLIHCFAGISRSTAAAYILACSLAEPGSEADLAKRLRALSPSATPNILMVALADNILQRDGAMLAAVKNIGRGADAFEGVPFEFSI